MRTAAVVVGVSCLCGVSNGFVTPMVQRTPSMVRFNARVSMATSVDELKSMKQDIIANLDKTNAHPIFIRLAWHDSGTYDKDTGDEHWPKCGGANGSIRWDPEMGHGANAGLVGAIKILDPIKKKYPTVSWADTFQMASATAIEVAGGPKIDMKYGRVDVTSGDGCTPDGRLPAAAAPFADGSKKPEDHLRKVFYRQGHDDQNIVALSGAHTLGRAFTDRSGFGKESTKYTDGSTVIRPDGKPGIGRKGGQSWTKQWLKFDNSYFAAVPEPDDDLLKLETDVALFKDTNFHPIALKYKKDEAAFFADYAKAHKQLSEQGSKFEPAEGIKID